MNPRTRVIPILTATSLACGAVALALLAPAPPDEPAPRTARADAAALLEDLAARADPDAFDRPAGPWTLALPADHGAHPGARIESWTLAVHLTDANGQRVGAHFALARFGIAPATAAADANAWTLDTLHRAHLTLIAEDAPTARSEERLSRGALGTAGADPATGGVRLDHWSLGPAPDGPSGALTLTATIGPDPVALTLTPAKPPVASGDADASPARGFTIPRLAVSGTIGAGETQRHVTGDAWLDRLWGELPLPGGPVAYDRLQLQLDDGTDLALIRSRRRDGRGLATTDAVLIGPDGTAATLAPEAIRMTATGTWEMPDTPGAWPTAWRIEGTGLDLAVTPVLDDQHHDFAFPSWIGLVAVEGTRDGRAVTGLGTLQLTGYETP